MLIALAIGFAGTTGISAVLATDPVASVALAGTLVDQHGAPIAGVDLVVSEEAPPDGGLAGFAATTGDDGSFTVQLYPWGTTDSPASVSIRTAGAVTITRETDGCSQTLSVTASDLRELALAEPASAPEPIVVVATTAVVGEACGTTATPPPNTSTGGAAGHTARPRVTPPATESLGTPIAPGGERPSAAVILGLVGTLVVTMTLVTPRPRSVRRRR